MIFNADKIDTSDCSVLECVGVMASLGLDVIPRENKWENMFHWSPPTCGGTPEYYIVEIRYATTDTMAFYNIMNPSGPHSIRVAAVDVNNRMSFFSDETFKPRSRYLYGVGHDAESLPCTEQKSIQMQ
jgi:hypothetical protein